MNRRALAVLAIAWPSVAGCGRLDFASQPDSTPLGHDEDGDGVPDALDNCPCTAGLQTDTDGDGVGDVCDPEWLIPREHLLAFWTLQPGLQPFTLHDGVGGSSWSQGSDALSSDTVVTFANATYTVPMTTVQVTLAFDIEAVAPVGRQRQIGVQVYDHLTSGFDYGELNAFGSGSDVASLAAIADNNGNPVIDSPLHEDVHVGSGTIQVRYVMGTSVSFEGGWPNEMYPLDVSTTYYTGGDTIEIVLNGMAVELTSLCIVETD